MHARAWLAEGGYTDNIWMSCTGQAFLTMPAGT